MGDKWYNSGISNYISQGVAYSLIFGTLILGGGSCYRQNVIAEAEAERIKNGSYIIRQGDFNKNGKREEFIEIRNKKFFSMIDGIDLESKLKE